MEEFLRSLMPAGADVLVAIQNFRNGFLDAVMTAATYMGKEQFYILFLPVLYWCVNKGLGRGLAAVFLLSEYLNGFFKDLFAIPRPYDFDPRITTPAPETSFAFPSSHAQGALVVWGFVASWARRQWMWVLATLLILLISFSRMYLGVHFPQDVLGGWVVGATVLAVYYLARRTARTRAWRVPLAVQAGAAVLIPVALFLAHPSESAAMVTGVASGILLGFILEARTVGFHAGGSWPSRVLRLVVGLIPLLVLYFGLKMVFPEGDVFRFLRYGLVGLWAGWLAPWMFVRLGLANRESGTGEAETAQALAEELETE